MMQYAAFHTYCYVYRKFEQNEILIVREWNDS